MAEHRKLREAWNTPYHAHALTFSTFHRQQILLLPQVPEIFLANLDVARKEFNFDVWSYVVMPEHVHLVIRPRGEIYSMPDILKAIKSPASKEIFALHPFLRDKCRVVVKGRKDEFRFWQPGGGYDHNVFTSKVAWAEIRYNHMNPVKHGLCALPTEWPYSSASAYLEELVSTLIPVDVCSWGRD